MITHWHDDFLIRHESTHRCKACDMEQAIQRVRELADMFDQMELNWEADELRKALENEQ